MGRLMPVECEHGRILDWGDHGNEWTPYAGLCSECMPRATVDRLTVEYRMNNRDWLEEHYRWWYALFADDDEGTA